MPQLHFGWRTPDWPEGNRTTQEFISDIHRTLEVVSEHFDSAWVADHFVPWDKRIPVQTDAVECMTMLAYLAAAYPKLTWGTIVLCQSYRNPALLAKMIANLCAFAPGRIVFGIGAGWKQEEYAAYGYPCPRAAVRIKQLDETCEIAKRLWTHTPATFKGEHYQIHEAYLSPKPDPLPPFMIGGGGEQLTLRVVAKHADWYNLPGGSRENYQHKLEVLRGHCAAVGTDYDRIIKSWSCDCVAVAATDAEARRIAEASTFCSPDSTLIGTPDHIAGELQSWVDLGVTHFQLRFADFPSLDGINLFAHEVLPRFRS
ncbi:MAG: LLM class flavin-dependent oxidoreductase [Herpetosiphonaceae bacterium]|nr:LLM class flavin-dependent oxidoreductase [Herpetosiphonaceae bacterium]